MNRQSLIYLALLLSVKAYGMTECLDVTNIHLKLTAHTSNIVNAATTHTSGKKGRRAEFYKKKDVVCTGHHCAVKQSAEKKVVYEPGHPDADRHGYVKYPDIDIKQEFAEVSKAANELKDLALKGTCQTQILQASEGVIVQYKKSHVLSDVFRYSKNNTLISWARTYLSGKREMFDYSARLSDRKLATTSFAF